ncbi:transposase family protein [Aeromonas australiensis]|nr:transposase family protein [Aeromonas australiensis]
MNINTIQEHFSIIRDERQSAKVDCSLFDILFGSIRSVIAGGQGWTDIREYVLGHHLIHPLIRARRGAGCEV